MEQTFYLENKDHAKVLQRFLLNSYKSSEFADVGLIADGKILQCHRAYLSSISPFFKSIFNTLPPGLTDVYVTLPRVAYEDLQLAVMLVYNGEITLAPSASLRMTKLVEFLGFPCFKSRKAGTAHITSPSLDLEDVSPLRSPQLMSPPKHHAAMLKKYGKPSDRPTLSKEPGSGDTSDFEQNVDNLELNETLSLSGRSAKKKRGGKLPVKERVETNGKIEKNMMACDENSEKDNKRKRVSQGPTECLSAPKNRSGGPSETAHTLEAPDAVSSEKSKRKMGPKSKIGKREDWSRESSASRKSVRFEQAAKMIERAFDDEDDSRTEGLEDQRDPEMGRRRGRPPTRGTVPGPSAEDDSVTERTFRARKSTIEGPSVVKSPAPSMSVDEGGSTPSGLRNFRRPSRATSLPPTDERRVPPLKLNLPPPAPAESTMVSPVILKVDQQRIRIVSKQLEGTQPFPSAAEQSPQKLSNRPSKRPQDGASTTLNSSFSVFDYNVPSPSIKLQRVTDWEIQELTSGVWRCKKCSRTQNSEWLLALHRDTDCETAFTPCVLCAVVSENFLAHALHAAKHAVEADGKCPICLFQPASSDTHMFSEGHLRVNDMPYVCEFCNHKFVRSADVADHLEKKHADKMEKPWKPSVRRCRLCRVEFASKNELQIHQTNDRTACFVTQYYKSIHGLKARCLVCSAIFPEEINRLKSHLAVHADKEGIGAIYTQLKKPTPRRSFSAPPAQGKSANKATEKRTDKDRSMPNLEDSLSSPVRPSTAVTEIVASATECGTVVGTPKIGQESVEVEIKLKKVGEVVYAKRTMVKSYSPARSSSEADHPATKRPKPAQNEKKLCIYCNTHPKQYAKHLMKCSESVFIDCGNKTSRCKLCNTYVKARHTHYRAKHTNLLPAKIVAKSTESEDARRSMTPQVIELNTTLPVLKCSYCSLVCSTLDEYRDHTGRCARNYFTKKPENMVLCHNCTKLVPRMDRSKHFLECYGGPRASLVDVKPSPDTATFHRAELQSLLETEVAVSTGQSVDRIPLSGVVDIVGIPEPVLQPDPSPSWFPELGMSRDRSALTTPVLDENLVREQMDWPSTQTVPSPLRFMSTPVRPFGSVPSSPNTIIQAVTLGYEMMGTHISPRTSVGRVAALPGLMTPVAVRRTSLSLVPHVSDRDIPALDDIPPLRPVSSAPLSSNMSLSFSSPAHFTSYPEAVGMPRLELSDSVISPSVTTNVPPVLKPMIRVRNFSESQPVKSSLRNFRKQPAGQSDSWHSPQSFQQLTPEVSNSTNAAEAESLRSSAAISEIPAEIDVPVFSEAQAPAHDPQAPVSTLNSTSSSTCSTLEPTAGLRQQMASKETGVTAMPLGASGQSENSATKKKSSLRSLRLKRLDSSAAELQSSAAAQPSRAAQAIEPSCTVAAVATGVPRAVKRPASKQRGRSLSSNREVAVSTADVSQKEECSGSVAEVRRSRRRHPSSQSADAQRERSASRSSENSVGRKRRGSRTSVESREHESLGQIIDDVVRSSYSPMEGESELSRSIEVASQPTETFKPEANAAPKKTETIESGTTPSVEHEPKRAKVTLDDAANSESATLDPSGRGRNQDSVAQADLLPESNVTESVAGLSPASEQPPKRSRVLASMRYLSKKVGDADGDTPTPTTPQSRGAPKSLGLRYFRKQPGGASEEANMPEQRLQTRQVIEQRPPETEQGQRQTSQTNSGVTALTASSMKRINALELPHQTNLGTTPLSDQQLLPESPKGQQATSQPTSSLAAEHSLDPSAAKHQQQSGQQSSTSRATSSRSLRNFRKQNDVNAKDQRMVSQELSSQEFSSAQPGNKVDRAAEPQLVSEATPVASLSSREGLSGLRKPTEPEIDSSPLIVVQPPKESIAAPSGERSTSGRESHQEAEVPALAKSPCTNNEQVPSPSVVVNFNDQTMPASRPGPAEVPADIADTSSAPDTTCINSAETRPKKPSVRFEPTTDLEQASESGQSSRDTVNLGDIENTAVFESEQKDIAHDESVAVDDSRKTLVVDEATISKKVVRASEEHMSGPVLDEQEGDFAAEEYLGATQESQSSGADRAEMVAPDEEAGDENEIVERISLGDSARNGETSCSGGTDTENISRTGPNAEGPVSMSAGVIDTDPIRSFADADGVEVRTIVAEVPRNDNIQQQPSCNSHRKTNVVNIEAVQGDIGQEGLSNEPHRDEESYTRTVNTVDTGTVLSDTVQERLSEDTNPLEDEEQTDFAISADAVTGDTVQEEASVQGMSAIDTTADSEMNDSGLIDTSHLKESLVTSNVLISDVDMGSDPLVTDTLLEVRIDGRSSVDMGRTSLRPASETEETLMEMDVTVSCEENTTFQDLPPENTDFNFTLLVSPDAVNLPPQLSLEVTSLPTDFLMVTSSNPPPESAGSPYLKKPQTIENVKQDVPLERLPSMTPGGNSDDDLGEEAADEVGADAPTKSLRRSGRTMRPSRRQSGLVPNTGADGKIRPNSRATSDEPSRTSRSRSPRSASRGSLALSRGSSRSNSQMSKRSRSRSRQSRNRSSESTRSPVPRRSESRLTERSDSRSCASQRPESTASNTSERSGNPHSRSSRRGTSSHATEGLESRSSATERSDSLEEGPLSSVAPTPRQTRRATKGESGAPERAPKPTEPRDNGDSEQLKARERSDSVQKHTDDPVETTRARSKIAENETPARKTRSAK